MGVGENDQNEFGKIENLKSANSINQTDTILADDPSSNGADTFLD